MLNQFFLRHSFKVILVVLFLLPVIFRGRARRCSATTTTSTTGCPTKYDETQDFAWFQKHFDNETFVLISWDGCTLDDPRLELFAKKIVPPDGPAGRRRPPAKAGPAEVVRRPVLRKLVHREPDPAGDSAARCSRASRPASGCSTG